MATGAPTLLEGLHARAHSGFQATVEIMKGQLDIAKQAAHERASIVKAGKKLLDEGGQPAAEVVIAKKASIAAAELDRHIAGQVHMAIIKLEDSVSKVAKLEPFQSNEANAVFTGTADLSQLAHEHEARASTCRQVAHLLDTPATSAHMSPEELDAYTIVRAKAGCATMLSTTSQSLENIRQKTLAGVTSLTAAGDVENVNPTQQSQDSTLLQGLQEHTRSGVLKVQQVVNSRFETVKAGKKLLEEGGERIALEVAAKEALLDACSIDREIARQVGSAVAAFDESSSKLRAVQSNYNGLAVLADEHESRADTYRQIASLLETPIGSLEMEAAEKDALSIVKMKDGCDALHRRTNVGLEAIKSMAFSGCAGPDGESRRLRAVCA